MTSMTLSCPFGFGEHVIIDGDRSLVGVVSIVRFESDLSQSQDSLLPRVMCECLVSWIANSDVKEVWLPWWRLTSVEGE